jgi:hypothetical protein
MTDSLIVGDWTVIPEERRMFSRGFIIRRSAPLTVEYQSFERRGRRYVETTYKAEVLEGRVTHGYRTDTGHWFSNGVVYLRLLKKDGSPYQSGWRAGLIGIDTIGSRNTEMTPDIHTFIDEIIEATRPQTKITITEEPANG